MGLIHVNDWDALGANGHMQSECLQQSVYESSGLQKRKGCLGLQLDSGHNVLGTKKKGNDILCARGKYTGLNV